MRKSGASSAESAIQDRAPASCAAITTSAGREGDPDRARRAAAAPENDGERRRVGGLQKQLRHQPGIAPDDAPLLDAQGRAGARAETRLSPRRGPALRRRARRGDRRAREALAEQHAGEREDDGAKSCPDEHGARVARRRAHRRPEEALRRARAIRRRRKGREDRRAHALGQHGDDLRPETADAPTTVAAIWQKRRARRGPPPGTGPSPE